MIYQRNPVANKPILAKLLELKNDESHHYSILCAMKIDLP